MTRYTQDDLALIEVADARIEALVASEGCAAHADIVLAFNGECLLCHLDEAEHKAVVASEALYAVQAVLAPTRWPDESEPEWVQRARAFSLPAKVLA